MSSIIKVDTIQDQDGNNIINENSDTITIGTSSSSISLENLKMNNGFGSQGTIYGIRAWVHFNGSGTVAIQQSGNVSSITDHGTGDYTINFTNAMPDINYAVGFMAGNAGATTYGRATQFNAVKTTTGFRVHTVYIDGNAGSNVDDAVVTYMVVR